MRNGFRGPSRIAIRSALFLPHVDARRLRLADRGYVLVNGTVRLSGTGKELLANAEVRSAYLEGGRA